MENVNEYFTNSLQFNLNILNVKLIIYGNTPS